MTMSRKKALIETGNSEQNPKKIERFSLRLASEKLSVLQKLAYRDRRSVASLIELCVDRYLPFFEKTLNEREVREAHEIIKGSEEGNCTLISSSITPIPPEKQEIGYLETTVEDLGDQADEDSVEATLEQIREDQINEANQIDN